MNHQAQNLRMKQLSFLNCWVALPNPTIEILPAIKWIRFALLVIAIFCCFGLKESDAQQWASKMVDQDDHDFGVVARGSDTVHRFAIKNIYKEDVEISSVRSSCGCTTPSIENRNIKTYEKAYIVAKFNTRTFTGPHSATLTVQISKPFPAQLQLRVHGNIRGDVVFEPGSVDFDSVSQGSELERTLTVTYAGRSNWKVQDVRSDSENIEAELVERNRIGGRVTYDLIVRLLDTAPPGFIKEQIVLVTNDGANPRIPIDITGKINPELTVAPQNLSLGEIPEGETVTKRFIVRGKKPFVVTSVDCGGDDCFTFETDETPATRQMVTVHFKADRKPGKVQKPITITTDLGGSYQANCQAYATVTPARPASVNASSKLGLPDPATSQR